jgi:NAD(P)H dehydrogenase (quinone)
MIIITGATGQLGSLVVDRLLERIPAEQVGVSVRDPEDAGSLAARGVRVRRGDFTDPASLTSAFEGADQVLVISAAIRGSDAAAAAHRAAIDAARASGAGRVLYTSHQGAAPDSRFDPARGHAATEQYLAASGGAYTVLRNGFYATTVPGLVDEGLRTGTVVA